MQKRLRSMLILTRNRAPSPQVRWGRAEQRGREHGASPRDQDFPLFEFAAPAEY